MRTEDRSQHVPEENSVLFWVNYDGFPISSHVWSRMFDHCVRVQPAFEYAIRNVRNELDPSPVTTPKPLAAYAAADMSVPDRVESIQEYMKELQYNHTGTQFFDIKKYRPLTGLMDSAKEMVRESLPIKCLESVILGIYLTNGLPGLERFPIGFKTAFGNNVHRHVVLGLCWMGLYGAVGISRRDDLMYKPLEFTNLGDLIIEYVESYHQYWHEVKKVKVGYPISHNPQSFETINWKGTTVNPSRMVKEDIRREMDRHSKEARFWVKHGPAAGAGAALSPRRPQLAPRRPLLPKPEEKVKDRASRFMKKAATAAVGSPNAQSQSFEMRI